MPTQEVQRTTRATVAAEIARQRLAYPSADEPTWRTVVNEPERTMGIQTRRGGWIYPEIVVVEEGGNFIHLLAVVVLFHEVTEIEAMERWLPLSRAGQLFLYVPSGQAGRANRLCHQLGIKVAGIRAWRRTPAFGIEVTDAYAGPDLLAPLFALLPPLLRPRAYRPERVLLEAEYQAPAAAARSEPALPAGARLAALPAPAAAPAEEAEVEHLLPSIWPAVLALGVLLTAFGFVFPAELLGAGIAITVVGMLGWIGEDIVQFGGGAGPAEAAATPAAEAAAHEEAPIPSLAPVMIALGALLAGFGVVFPAELLGAGMALLLLGLLGWIREDVEGFMTPVSH